MGAKKNDQHKPDLSMVSRTFKQEVAYGLMAGASKYGDFNYMRGFEIRRLLAAAERHLDAIKSGEDFDENASKEIGRPVFHAALVACNRMMLLDLWESGGLTDNRYKPTS